MHRRPACSPRLPHVLWLVPGLRAAQMPTSMNGAGFSTGGDTHIVQALVQERILDQFV